MLYIRSNGKDAAAGADVQHPLAAGHPLVQRFHAQAGGLVAAGAEGKARVKDQLHPVSVVLLPRGHQDRLMRVLSMVVANGIQCRLVRREGPILPRPTKEGKNNLEKVP